MEVTFRSKEVERLAFEFIPAQLRTFLPGCLNENLKQVVAGDLALLTILEAGNTWICHGCMRNDHAKEEQGHPSPMSIHYGSAKIKLVVLYNEIK